MPDQLVEDVLESVSSREAHDERQEISFLLHGFVSGSMLPINLTEMISRDRFHPFGIRQQITVIGGGHEQFSHYLSATSAIVKYISLVSSKKRSDMKDFHFPVFGGTPGISASTRMELPSSIDPISVVREVAESNGFCYTDDNHVVYRGISCTSSGTEALDIEPSYITAGQLVELRVSFRAFPTRYRQRIFKPKLNSVTVYSSSASRTIQMLSELASSREEIRKARERELLISLGAPRKRRHLDDIPSSFDDIAFLRRPEEEKRLSDLAIGEVEDLFDFQI
ncbi:hypothetical protein SCHPADRAFT_885786 [Schizopora paradoxa]|uniref:Uncharacterized protein n=1 Tax=Schizopora paradoxa TaxID=27342 RepID=A0A0H2SP57_9AGAM|nr:hypothetical protein SCHPADRAFT_885786 [Schizopora paradoxa]